MAAETRRGSYYLVQAVTLARLPISIAFAVILSIKPETPPVVLCIALLIVAEITDTLDGTLARRLGVTSEFGAMLDPYIDSISRLIVYFALACVGKIWPVLPLGMAIRDVTVAYARIELARAGKSVKAMLWGKIKAVVQAVGAMLVLFVPAVDPGLARESYHTLSAIILFVTLASAVQYVRAALSAGRSG